ncbi:HU family DNA-binding protein [Alicyclobacillus macrosporangiidus]|uniref:DNA-binding protein HU-beta n=1 Tax=Alicyclobacillus macrosporangiidus TaxID=392015 RepID=A0A1I7LHH7_9BACL|nr:HU family DNA-binding protein [Alicyclobacillus macrosporangiidus]SFV09110.1 DNA-binding protein HU-beta [Alicyclobacillus macrosporangiidus]
MNKSDLVRKVAQQTGVTNKECEVIVGAVFETIKQALEAGEKVQIAGFGTFETKERAERTARNPVTGDKIVVPRHRVPIFKAGSGLKEVVRS